MNDRQAHTSLSAAQAAIAERAQRLASDPVGLSGLLGRVLAQPVVARTSLPPFDNSAMDGFALRAADTSAAASSPVTLDLAGESRAGHPAASALPPGSAFRISTGAAMPDGADAVLRVEDAEIADGALIVRSPIAAGADVRPAGDDIRNGDAVLPAGIRVSAGELAMATAAGATDFSVTRRPKINIVTTGEELVPSGSPLERGQIYDSNSGMLAAQAAACGGAVGSISARVADQPEAVDTALAASLADADVVVVCGGVSVGAHDHVKDALARAGVEQIFWQVAMRPGHPTWFGTHGRDGERPTLVFGLPGNPVSAYVTFQLFVAPALRKLEGLADRQLRLRARYAGLAVKKRIGFAQVLRCTLSRDGDQLLARLSAENQRSHALASLVGAQALGYLPEDSASLEDGDWLEVEPIGDQYTLPGR